MRMPGRRKPLPTSGAVFLDDLRALVPSSTASQLFQWLSHVFIVTILCRSNQHYIGVNVLVWIASALGSVRLSIKHFERAARHLRAELDDNLCAVDSGWRCVHDEAI